jgi:hypothetical protein
MFIKNTSGQVLSGSRGGSPAWGKQFKTPHLENTYHKKGLTEWLKVKALRSSLSMAKKKKKKKKNQISNEGKFSQFEWELFPHSKKNK